MGSVRKLPDGRWQARYRAVSGGKQYSKTTKRKVDAENWLAEQTSKLVTGTWSEPKTARTTVAEWCDTWLEGYGTRRPSTVRAAKIHLAQIRTEFGELPLSSVRPSHVRAWTAKLAKEGHTPSYIYVLHSRLSQIFSDAVHDGVVPRSPCSRRTSPGQGKQRPFVASTEQVWALHGTMPERYRVAVLLGAFVGLRAAEACGLRVADVDFMRGVVSPAVQYPVERLKTETSRTPVPISRSLALELAAQVERWPAETLLTTESGSQLSPGHLRYVFSVARDRVKGLPAGFRFQDLRHYYASLLIASGGDVKVVQARLRHASATTTLNTYAHLWPDRDDSTRAAVEQVFAERAEESVRNGKGVRPARRRSAGS